MVRASAPGGIAGFIADNLLNTFPLGTLAGTFHKGLFSLLSGDMNRAYDPARATQGAYTHDFGELKDMASGLFGDIKAAVQARMGEQKGPSGPSRSRSEDGPHDQAGAQRSARPHVNEDARREAQSEAGLGGWGKALMYGGLALGGLTLLREFSMGGFGMPYYGGMTPWMMPGTMPGMMPGLFW